MSIPFHPTSSIRLLPLLAFFILGASLPALAQVKHEAETGVRPEQVPGMALAFVEFCQFRREVRWIEERSELGLTYEAKARHDGRHLSIEFDSLGNLLDLEVEIRPHEIPSPAREQVGQALDARFSAHRVERAQAQYVGPEQEVLAWVLAPGEVAWSPSFELVVQGRDAEGVHTYELLFDPEGRLLRESRLVLPNTEHLDH